MLGSICAVPDIVDDRVCPSLGYESQGFHRLISDIPLIINIVGHHQVPRIVYFLIFRC